METKRKPMTLFRLWRPFVTGFLKRKNSLCFLFVTTQICSIQSFNCRIPCHLCAFHPIRIATIVINLVLQSTTTQMKWSWSGWVFCSFSQAFTSWVQRVNILFGIFIVALYILVLHTVFRAVLWSCFTKTEKKILKRVRQRIKANISFNKILLKPKLPQMFINWLKESKLDKLTLKWEVILRREGQTEWIIT